MKIEEENPKVTEKYKNSYRVLFNTIRLGNLRFVHKLDKFGCSWHTGKKRYTFRMHLVHSSMTWSSICEHQEISFEWEMNCQNSVRDLVDMLSTLFYKCWVIVLCTSDLVSEWIYLGFCFKNLSFVVFCTQIRYTWRASFVFHFLDFSFTMLMLWSTSEI